MFRKTLFVFFLLTCAVVFGSAAAFAQTNAPVSGTVEMEGTHAPVANALVEAYRMDIKQAPLSVKTNKSGSFMFPGLPLGPDFALAVSGPGITPSVYSGVHAGTQNVVISVTAGDGKKYTEAEVRSYTLDPKKGGEGEMSAEEKKQRAEIEAKNAEIMAKNEKIKNADEVARKSNEEGNAAYNSGNYDLAIQKYTEGINAVPDFIGSTPILWSGKMNSLKAKGRLVYNEAVKITDLDQKRAKLAEAAKIYDEALAGFEPAMKVVASAEAPKDPADQKRRDMLKLGLYSIAIDAHRLRALAGGTSTNVDQVAALITEYQTLETDAAKKASAQMTLGDIMRVTEHREQAVAAYRKVLEMSPENLDAEAYLGLGLVDLAWLKDNDKAMSQEGANYLQKFVATAPDTHPLKEGAVQYLNILKTQNIVPVKQPGKKKT